MAAITERAERIPLFALLSQVLIAFTMEFDNEFERRMAAVKPRKFRLSMAMWSNFMRFVDERGITVRELESKASLLSHMKWWGYVTVAPSDGTRESACPTSLW